NSSLIARLDCLNSFAAIALKNKYVIPELNDTYIIDIKGGRHPVIEQQLAHGESYVDNDVYLDTNQQQILMITGPNMSGKSALLRQTALIVLMAQMGSFVPASSAQIGYVDKVFTRVGASDNISSGESTFMVEMNETASILNNISSRSLVLLDEIGRGTSTYDGISIAWAITEYLHDHPAFRAKVMFATHYHELNEMAASFSRICNYHVAVKETANKVIFLRKLKKGGSAHSFGIHVATMAGMPRKVIDRANKLLVMLEKTHSDESFKQAGGGKSEKDGYQLSFIQLDDPLLLQIKDDILNTNIDTLTPIEALLKLHEIRKLLGK
ncbi:MAG: DNA mismatch repair protein MutS, partial [Ignavibacteria bacterium]|nr:DNA mismatch repair protein MutS [Ignavibacteria bacterium]